MAGMLIDKEINFVKSLYPYFLILDNNEKGA